MQLRVIYCQCCERPFRSIVRCDADMYAPLTLEKGHWLASGTGRMLCGGIVCNVQISAPHNPFAPAKSFDELVMLPVEFDYLTEFAAACKTWVALEVELVLRDMHADYNRALAAGRLIADEHAADRCDDFIAEVDYVLGKLRSVPELRPSRAVKHRRKPKKSNERSKRSGAVRTAHVRRGGARPKKTKAALRAKKTAALREKRRVRDCRRTAAQRAKQAQRRRERNAAATRDPPAKRRAASKRLAARQAKKRLSAARKLNFDELSNASSDETYYAVAGKLDFDESSDASSDETYVLHT